MFQGVAGELRGVNIAYLPEILLISSTSDLTLDGLLFCWGAPGSYHYMLQVCSNAGQQHAVLLDLLGHVADAGAGLPIKPSQSFSAGL